MTDRRAVLAGYAAAVLGPAAATALALALAPATGGRAGHLLMAPVALAAWWGGWGPGLLATVLGGLALDYFFEVPEGSFAVESPNTVLNLLAYVLVAGVIAWSNHSLAAARDAARAAQAAAEAATRLRDGVLATISHDLRGPLTVITAAAQLGRRRLDRPGPALAAELARIEAAAERMARQINELLDAARLQAGQRLELHRRPVDLVALARAAAEEHQRSTDRHRIRVEAGAEAVVGGWDGFRLERVLDNLLSNAVKYSPAGGEITVGVAVDRDAGGTWARVSVADAGLGIPAADLPRVFEQFGRASNVGRIAGTGIGLAGARQIVEQHGGSLTVESQEGAGSTFTVRLPLAPGGPATGR
jgi:signal transduction histidine kinase